MVIDLPWVDLDPHFGYSLFVLYKTTHFVSLWSNVQIPPLRYRRLEGVLHMYHTKWTPNDRFHPFENTNFGGTYCHQMQKGLTLCAFKRQYGVTLTTVCGRKWPSPRPVKPVQNGDFGVRP